VPPEASNARTAGDPGPEAASPHGLGPWAQAHAGFLRAMLLILAYCSAVISMISIIAFRGINAVAIGTATLCIIAVVTVFLLRRSREPSK
jgi:hypothetical protein